MSEQPTHYVNGKPCYCPVPDGTHGSEPIKSYEPIRRRVVVRRFGTKGDKSQ